MIKIKHKLDRDIIKSTIGSDCTHCSHNKMAKNIEPSCSLFTSLLSKEEKVKKCKDLSITTLNEIESLIKIYNSTYCSHNCGFLDLKYQHYCHLFHSILSAKLFRHPDCIKLFNGSYV